MQQKQTIVQAGQYEGKEAIILGSDYDYYGCAIFGLGHKDGRDVMIDYMKRLALEPVSTLSKVFIANIDGKIVALNQYEIDGKDSK